ncbi:MAG: LysR family transcriptional regulator [Bacillota bacterium]|nr:LysR family transcriptional regulator [Bacillota bacterium]
MESHDLLIFKQVAERQSVSKAAENLGYVQSNISQRIKSLEDELGAKLFVRNNRGVTLTDKGTTLLDYANRILLLLDEAKSAFNPQKWRETLTIGAPQTISAFKVPQLFSLFLKKHKNMDVKVRTSDKQSLQDMLYYGELDGLFVHGPYDEGRLESVYSYEQNIVLIAPEKWELETPYNQTLIVNSFTSCSYRDALLHYSESNHFYDPTILEFDTLESILQAVQNGLGISILPEDVLNSRKELSPIECKKLSEGIKINFVVKQRKYQPHVLKKFISFLWESS